MSAARFLVAGKVQGVYFRASAREQAVRLGLRGYACNLDDGRVEVLAIGEDTAIAALEKWLWQGPRLARVADVAREPVSDAPVVFGFEAR
ncbi:MAG: acylphosphatase [Arenimonas sp.]